MRIEVRFCGIAPVVMKNVQGRLNIGVLSTTNMSIIYNNTIKICKRLKLSNVFELHDEYPYEIRLIW